MTLKLGNPAPLGLFAFGMTTSLLMYVEMGWVEHEFQERIFGLMAFYGGLAQLVVGVFELIHGSTFGFAAFCSYGAYWMCQALVFHEEHSADSSFTGDYKDGKVAFFATWGLMTVGFWSCTFRKNIALVVVFGLLWVTFFLLAGASSLTGESKANFLKVAGAVGFATALSAFYTGFAELINEEYGCDALPGLQPLAAPRAAGAVDARLVRSRASYWKSSNTLRVSLRGLHIAAPVEVEAIVEGLRSKIAESKPPGGKVHALIDYEGATIAEGLAEEYWRAVRQLEADCYLSARRHHVVPSFGGGEGSANLPGVAALAETRPSAADPAAAAAASKKAAV